MYNGAKTLADDIAKFVEPKLAKVKPAIDGVIKKVKDSKVVKAVSNFFGKAVNFVKARMGKFNPDLAPAAEKAADKQMAAQMEAERRADEALRQQELTRKRALLAEQTGLAARSNAARNVRNTLQGLASSKLGSEEDKLGGA